MSTCPPITKHAAPLVACPAEAGGTLNVGTVATGQDMGNTEELAIRITRKGPERRAIVAAVVSSGTIAIEWPALLEPGYVYTFELVGTGGTSGGVPLRFLPFEYDADTSSLVASATAVDEVSALVDVHRDSAGDPATFTEQHLVLTQ